MKPLTIEIPEELGELSVKFGLEPQFLAARILTAWAKKHKDARHIVIRPQK